MTEKPEREEYACRVDETAQPEVNEDGSPPKGAHVVGTHGTTVGTVMPNDQKRAHPSERSGRLHCRQASQVVSNGRPESLEF